MRRILRRYKSVMHGNYFKMSLLYGIVMGVAMILILLLRYLCGSKPSSPISLWDNISMLVLMAICVLHYRSILEDKKMTFKEGWLVGFYSGCIAAILFGMFMYLYSNGIDKEMTLRCANILRQIPEYASYTNDQIAQMSKPSTIALYSIIYNIVMAILWAFLVGIILKNENAKQLIKTKQKDNTQK